MKKKLLITLGCSLTEGVGCYDTATIPPDMVNMLKHEKFSEVYDMNRERFHKFSWPSYLQKQLNYDFLINLGLGASSTSGNLKVWFEKYYDKNFSNEFDVLIIWLLPEASRFSFYRNSYVKNIIPYTRLYSFNSDDYYIGKEYLKFIKETELDTMLEQTFYLKIFEEHCKFNNYNFLYTPVDYTRNKFFNNFYNTENRMIFNDSILPNFSKYPSMKSLICNHPNELGYDYVSNKMFEWIQLNRPELISTNIPTKFEANWDGYPISNLMNVNKSLI